MNTDATFPLWPGRPPGALGDGEADRPTLTRFDPPAGRANGASMLVLPGGGYARLADHEGAGFARWLARLGVTAFVLKYRLGSDGYRHEAIVADARRAMRTVRRLARAEGRDPARIGVIGSSAGGHLASVLLTGFDAGEPGSVDPTEQESSRPDVGVLCYPVISMRAYPHQGSVAQLLGSAPTPESLERFSSDLRVTENTPPCFLWHTADDAVVPVGHAQLFATALRRCAVPFELHIYESGIHGLGLPGNNPAAPAWDAACVDWLRRRRFF